MAIRLLGPVEVDGPGHLSPRDRVVLAALALHSGDSLSSERLADALWGDDLPASWQKVVQGCVVRLRRVLGKDAVQTTPGGYRLNLTDEEIDVRRFERLALRGRALAAAGEHRRAAATLAEALDLWRGPALGELEHWLPGRTEASRLVEMRNAVEESLVEEHVEVGDDAVPSARALVTEEPLREHRWALLATALYRSNRQVDALAALRRARATLADELGLDPGPELVALEHAILTHDPGLAPPPGSSVPDSGICPYKGLVAYDREDAERFFGRSDEVARCLHALSVSPLVVVVGPSGCGKSSLVRAGVVPALEQVGRQVALMTPGTDPESGLVAAISAPGRELALVVDQLEELFTAGHDRDVVVAFLDRLAQLAWSDRKVIAVVRADHVSSLSISPAFARLAERGMHLVTPMTEQEMSQGIVGPAAQAGLRLEPGLVELLLREVEREPGALPLLSHALAETWERREADVLTVDGYRATGGIRSAVAQSAELLYESLQPGQQAAVRSILLRLVTPSVDGEPVTTRVPMNVVEGDPERARLLELLVHARLVTTDERTVVLAHEAVVRAWPRLQSWLDEDVAGQRTLRHLSLAAEDWAARGRPDSELYRGARLESALDWQVRERPDLTPVEGAFLDASAGLAEAELDAERQRVHRQARDNRRLRVALAGIAAGLVLALLAGTVAVEQGRGASRAARAAEVQRLVAQSVALRTSRRDLAALLALQAYRLQPDASTRSALFGIFTGSPGFLDYQSVPAPVTSADVLADNRTLLAVSADGAIRAIDLDSSTLVRTFPVPSLRSVGALITVSADQKTVVEVSWEGPEYGGGRDTLVAYDIATGAARFAETRLPLDVGAVAVAPDGSRVAVSGYADGRVIIYDMSTGAQPAPLQDIGHSRGIRGVREVGPLGRVSDYDGVRHTAALAFTPDGQLVVGSLGGAVRVIDPATGVVVRRLAEAAQLTSNNQALVSADGSRLVTTGTRGIASWDLRTGALLWTAPITEDRCASAVLAPAIGGVLCGGRLGHVVGLDRTTGVLTGRRFDMQRGDISALTVTRDGHTLVEMTATEPVISRWRLDGTGPIATALSVPGSPHGYSSDGRLLIVSTLQGGKPPLASEIVDARTGAVQRLLGNLYAPVWTADPHVLASWDADAYGHLVDVRSGQSRALQGNFGNVPDPADVTTRGDFLLAWGGGGGTSRLSQAWNVWAIHTGTKLAARSSPTTWAGASLSTDGRLLVAAGGGRVASFDVSSGALVAQHSGVVNAAVSPQNTVAVSTVDGALAVYDVRSLRPTTPPIPGIGDVAQFAFSSDGSEMVARGIDGNVRIVDMDGFVRQGEPIELGATADQTVALSPDGSELAVPGPEGILVWQLQAHAWASAACRLAGRNLTQLEWSTYLAGLGGYTPTCPGLSARG